MGSFYGNIKNSNKSQFTFDKVYPNRRQADLYAEHDSVFTGRYILVDYDYYDGVDGGWDNYDTIHGKDDNIKGVGRLAKEKRSSDEKFQSLATVFGDNNEAYSTEEAKKRLQLLQETLATCKNKIGQSEIPAKGLLAEKKDLEKKISNASVTVDTTEWENRLVQVNAELEYYETLRDDTLLKIGNEEDTNVNTAYGDLWRAKLREEYKNCFDRRNVYTYGGHLDNIGVITYDEDKNTTPYLTPGFTKYSLDHVPERDKSYFYKETDENNKDIWYVDNNYDSVIAHWGIDREYYYFHWGKNTVFTVDYKARVVDQEIEDENGKKHTVTLTVYDVEDRSNYVLTYANLVWDSEGRVHMEYELESIGSETEKYMYVFNYDAWEEYNKDPESYNYYLCTEYNGSVETWKHISDPSYLENYNIDQDYCETHIGRGYDCTVWQKIYSNGKLSYAMLAELNSVVPTFAISADAPTEKAMAPHFDDKSTNVFYHLHTQPSWGMRIKKADESISESDGLRYMSDADDKSAIYYNKKGFDPSIITISDKYGVGDNNLNGVSEDHWGWKPGQPDVIDVLSTGKSGTLYNQYVKDENGNIMLNNAGYPMHDLDSEMIEQPDTKEIVAMLPSFGDTIAEMWNLTYGDEKANKEYNRRFSDNYAEQGRHRNMNVDWDDNHTGLRLVTRERDGYHFEKDQVQTIAGAINTTHDFIGKIIRNYPVYYKVPDYESAKVFDINTTYYRFNSDTGKYERTGLLTQKEFDDNKSNLYVEKDIPIEELSDNRIYYKKPTYELYYDIDEENNNKDFVPNMHYFAWDPVEYKFSDILTFDYSKESNENSTEPSRVEKLRLCDITDKYQFEKATKVYKQIYVVKDEGKFFRKYKYYDFYNESDPSDKKKIEEIENENRKDIFITGPKSPPEFDINDNFYVKTNHDLIDYNDSNKYYFSESPDYLYETRGYFEEDKEYYTISEVPGSHASLFNQYDVNDNYYWSIKEEDKEASTPEKKVYKVIYVKSEDEIPTPAENKHYYYYDNFGDPELIEDEFIYAPNVYFYADLTKLVSKFGWVQDVDYTIDSQGNYILSEDLENQYIPLTREIDYEHAKTILEYDKDHTKLQRAPWSAIAQNCVYFYPTLKGGFNSEGFENEELISSFTRIPKMVNFDAEHFYQDVYVDADAKDPIKYYSQQEWDNMNPAGTGTDKDRPENYYMGIGKIDTNPINLRTEVGLDNDPIPYIYQKPYKHYFICNERYLTGSGDLVKPNMHRVIDFYEPGKWYYYKEGVGYILEESDHANPEINKKYEKIVDAWYSLGNTSTDNIPASNFFESGCYCKIVPEYKGNGFIPDTYYVKKTDGTYELAHKYEEGKTYYDREQLYVVNDEYEVYQKGMKWELDFIPKGVTLSIRRPHYELIELPGFARTANTLNGIILKSHELIGDGEDQLVEGKGYKNFEPDNIQGVLNTYENHFETHVKTHHESDIGNLTIIDKYGRIAAAKFTSEQEVDYTNIGKPSSNPASEPGQHYLSYIYKKDDILNQDPNNQVFNLIHVPAHKKADTTTTADKNTDGTNGNGLNAAHGNTISLYTPIVDSMGHIVGKNTETVTLPYGFKTITTNGRSTDNDATYGNKTALAAQANLVADNTQDTLAIDSGDSWIKLVTDAANDKITISHDVKKTSTSTSTATLSTETNSTTTFDVFTYTFDDRNHFKNVDTKTITMPNSYGKIIGDNKADGKNVVSEATATHDTFAIIGDNWLTSTISKDKVTLTHDNANSVAERKVANVTPAFGSTFTIEDWRFDSKGHMYGGAETHTVKIPQGSYTNTPATANAIGVITSIGFTPTTGAITSTSNYLGAIKLGSYTKPTTIKTLANASITASDFDTNTTLSSAINALDSRIMAEEKARADAIDGLDVTGASNISSSKTISSWSETNGKVNITTQDISITSSQVSDKTDTYNATGTTLVTGKAIANAISSLNLSTTYEAHGAASAVEQRLMEIIGTAGTPASIKSGVTLYRKTGSTYVTVTANELVDGVTYYKDNTGTTQAVAGTDYTLKVAGTGLIGRIEELENK